MMASTSPQDHIEVVVYYADGSGVLLKVREGQKKDASDLFDMVLEELEIEANLHPIIKEVFSLWLVSDLLELQLKPTHVPFKLVCYWEELLEKYTTAPEAILQRDEPILVFRRNVFADISLEIMIENEVLLGLLYEESLRNVLRGRYGGNHGGDSANWECVNDTTGSKLAAIQAAILNNKMKSEGKTDNNFGTTQYFKTNLKDYLPTALCKRNLIFNRDSNPEVEIAKKYRDEANSNRTLTQLYKSYLEICRKFFFYASAFFVGQVEHPGKKVDDPVLIGVNENGVSIIDLDDQVWLLSVPYSKLNWQYAVSKSINADSLPSIFLHWKHPNKHLLQIFTRSALLIDNLIEAFVNLKKISGNDNDEVKFSDCDLAEKFKKLALETFNNAEIQMKKTPKSKNEIA